MSSHLIEIDIMEEEAEIRRIASLAIRFVFRSIFSETSIESMNCNDALPRKLF